MSESVLGVAPVPGMDITGVIYRYTAVKNSADPFTVSVQNERADGNGFVFRETDDWSGRPGATINKLVPVGYSPISDWGAGSVATSGVGSVEDPDVVYTYRIDQCYDPQSNPSCSGYVEPPTTPKPPAIPEITDVANVADELLPEPTVIPYNPMNDPLVQQVLAPTDPDLYEDDDWKDKPEEEKESLEKALAAEEGAMQIAEGQNAMLRAMNPVTMTNYYAATIPGGVYPETVVLVDSKLPDNKRAFRSMANDNLHTKMVEEQWK
jgi:hypothetical protein